MVVSINLLDLSVLIIGWILLWKILPEEYREELGALIGWFLMFLWLVIWIIAFVLLGFDLTITSTGYIWQ